MYIDLDPLWLIGLSICSLANLLFNFYCILQIQRISDFLDKEGK